MRISVDRTRCQGIGMCEMAAPTVFVVGEDSQAHVLDDPGELERGAVEEAVATCPTAALTYSESVEG